jgi:hypothetical protein
MDWISRVIARVSHHEGGYDSLNRNTDGAGLSWGILQWTQHSGNLGKLLAAMRAADATAFERFFGAAWPELLRATLAASLAPVAGAVLWEPPWTDRFREAGQYGPFQEVQRRVARQGEHFRAAVDAARVLGVATERSMALLLDTSVHQGPGAVVQVAHQVRDRFAREGRASVPYTELLTAYAQRAADRCRRFTQPAALRVDDRLHWEKVGAEWHLFAETIDLYTAIHRRRMGIVRDRDLTDEPIALEGSL